MTIITKDELYTAMAAVYRSITLRTDVKYGYSINRGDRLDAHVNYVSDSQLRYELRAAAERFKAHCAVEVYNFAAAEHGAPQHRYKNDIDLDAIMSRSPRLNRLVKAQLQRSQDFEQVTPQEMYDLLATAHTAHSADPSIRKEIATARANLDGYVRYLRRSSRPSGEAGALRALCHGTWQLHNVLHSMQERRSTKPSVKASPVADWLQQLFKPTTVVWTTNDPITNVLSSAIAHASTTTAKSAATYLLAQHTARTTTPEVAHTDGFAAAVAALKAVSGTGSIVDFTDALRTKFGESFRLDSNNITYTVTPRITLMRQSKTFGLQQVLWASSDAPVYRDMQAVGEVFDFTHEANMKHLLKCYNAHTRQPSDTLPCSHFSSPRT